MILNATTALFPGDTYEMALSKMHGPNFTDGGWPISIHQVQLCPQNHGKLTRPLLSRLQNSYPNTKFRLHATCRLDQNGYKRFEASTPLVSSLSYFQEMAELSSWLGAPAYSLHAGKREEATLEIMKKNVQTLQDFFGCPVAVEGLYPTKGDSLLVSTWAEYQWLMDSGLFYAVDMSHLNIVAARLRNWDTGLVAALLQHPNCIEVHISSNNGYSDSHHPIDGNELPSWWPLLDLVNDEAVIFTESNQRKRNDMRGAV